jgi:glycosyltransferase involved in cell wall biosynthesis
VKLLIDAQCVQSTSSLRGIGRYALSLTRALVQESGEHRVEVLLNGGDDPGRLLRARTALEGFLPPGRIHVFEATWPWQPPYDDRRRPVAEAAYAAAVRSIGPDALLVGSVFEGDTENVLSIRPTPADPPAAAVLYDLIPGLDPGTYLLGPGAPVYWRRLEELKRCDALLAISRYSGGQAEQLLGQACPPVTPVWGGPYPSGDFPAFEQQTDDAPGFVLPERFVLTVGGDHPRKNLDRLVAAWGRVPQHLRARSPLVVACRLNPGTVRRLRRIARRSGLGQGEVILTGGVSESTLNQLYERAAGFVFPSTEEGLGMPPLEAMSAGCPTLLARGSSLSELSMEQAAFFDGRDVPGMADAMTALLADEGVRERLRDTAAVAAERFTWRHSAQLAWQALEALPSADLAVRPAATAVRLSDARGLEGLAAAPAPVRLDTALPDGAPGLLGLPVVARAALAPATALIANDLPAASAAVRAGLLDAPVLVGDERLDRVAAHDFHAEYAAGLAELSLDARTAGAVVEAVSRAPRWTLERPRPVWLLLRDDAVDPGLAAVASGAGVDLVVAGSGGVSLAGSVDVVLAAAADIGSLEAPLALARRRGARVVALHVAGSEQQTPSWCEDVTLDGSIDDAAAWRPADWSARWGRTTGWPWRDEH